MFEAYRVGIRLTLLNDVSRGLFALSGDFTRTELKAAGLDKRIQSIKRNLYGGGFLIGAGTAFAAPIIYAIDKAAELQKQMIGIQIATRGSVGQMENLRKQIEGISGQTIFSNIEVANMAKMIAAGTGFNATELGGALPKYAQFADVQSLMKGTPYDQSIKDAIRLAHTANKYAPKELTDYLDLLNKASFIVPGGLGEVGHALKYSQGVARTALGVPDQDMILMTALLNRLGFSGSRGGTNLIAAMTRSIPGVFGSGQSAHSQNPQALAAMGFTDAKGAPTFFTNGRFDMFKWMAKLSEYVAIEFARHDPTTARTNILKNFQYGFGTQGSRIAALLSTPQAIEQLNKIGLNFREQGGVEAIQKRYANESVAQQWQNTKGNFISAMTELGYTLLPEATRALKATNIYLKDAIHWIHEHGTATKMFGEALLVLGAGLAFTGTVKLLAGAFGGLRLVLGGLLAIPGVTALASAGAATATTVAGGGGTMAALGVGGGALALGGAGAAATTYGLAQFFTWLNDQATTDPHGHPGMRFYNQTRSGAGGWRTDPSLDQSHIGQTWVHGGRGASAGHWVPEVPQSPTNASGKTGDVHIDGRKVGEVITPHLAEGMRRGNMGGPSGYDQRVSIPPSSYEGD